MEERLKILDVWVDQVDMNQALNQVEGFIRDKKGLNAIFAVNPEKNFSVPKDSSLHEIFKDADLIIPDGIGIVMAAWYLYGIKMTRVPGVELMENICRLAAEKDYKVFVYGAKEGVNRDAVKELKRRYPNLNIVGRSNGYVQEDEMDDLIEKINTSQADILFLALGSPRQEKWYAKYKNRLEHVSVCQGIGGTLDAITGAVKRAPEFWINYNLEWLYRLLKEPERVKRQRVLPVFVYKVILERFKKEGIKI